MKVKYIGKPFAEEVEILVGTLINLPFDYVRHADTAYILHFSSASEAQEALVHLKHFSLSCFQAEPVLDGNKIVFVQKPTIAPSKSYLRKRDAYLRKLFKNQTNNLERMLKADERSYRRRGLVFSFSDFGGMQTAMECLTLDPTPSSPFGYGLLEWTRLDSNTIRILCRKDVSYSS
jgi:hypothetical protein